MSRVIWMAGMLGSVAAALAGTGLPEPYNHYAMLIGTVSAAITGYNVRHPAPPWDGIDRRGNST